jgi:threonyl-tRNA synthetase
MIRPRLLRPSGLGLARSAWTCPSCLSKRTFASKADADTTANTTANTTAAANPPTEKKPKEKKPAQTPDPPDHRQLGVQQELFMTSIYSPGSPILLPNGARIFNRLTEFIRKQYVHFGFEEVITPTIYKKSLWAKSGHLENYADDMYSVSGNKKTIAPATAAADHTLCCGTDEKTTAIEEDDDYGLKPMNCPGHCLIFASKNRSYRDLPIRYADFSPLHRNEISGALSGLTRVRRFHQDDGHIFCRPVQIEAEIRKTLRFVERVYKVLKIGDSYRLALSTRPKDHYIGNADEWDRAEAALKRALDASGTEWTINEGDGAFYGPKIDIVIKDSDGKEHQTATVQLDFQLPKRFELEYQAPAPEYEARGEVTKDPGLLASYGPVRPVMIHRAVLGSVERLMAILIEKYNKSWPFWLAPKQAIICTVTTDPAVVTFANHARKVMIGDESSAEDEYQEPTGLVIDVDASAKSIGAKLRAARQNGYKQVFVVGDQEVESGKLGLGPVKLTPEDMRDRLLAMVRSYK